MASALNTTYKLYSRNIDNLDDGKQTDLIVTDFSKAFDKVDHNLLIYKPFNLGVNLKGVVSWIKTFLQERNQSVVVEGKQSPLVPVMSGVPQGSVLGPRLFLSYKNDLPDSLKSRARLFAEDSIVYLTINSPSDPEILQADLHKLAEWESNWSMEFNLDKCEVMLEQLARKILSCTHINFITLCSNPSKQPNILELQLKRDLNWKPHIEISHPKLQIPS